MRSVFIFTNAPGSAIAEVLDAIAERSDHEWIGTEIAVIRIEEPPNWADGWQEVDRREIERDCGGLPARLVVADISGRIEGTSEASELALRLLALGPGAVFDDHSETPWTKAELEAGINSAGRRLLHPG